MTSIQVYIQIILCLCRALQSKQHLRFICTIWNFYINLSIFLLIFEFFSFSKDLEYNTEKIVDVNDSIIDRININIDNETGVNEPSNNFIKGIMTKPNVAAWNAAPVIAKIQVRSFIRLLKLYFF